MSFTQFENRGFELAAEPGASGDSIVVQDGNGFANRMADVVDFSERTEQPNGSAAAPAPAPTPTPKEEKYQSQYDAIEVEVLGGPKEEKPEDVLVNAKDFFLEHNDNYRLSWDEASHRVADGGLQPDEDPSKPPVPGLNHDYVRWKTRRVVESIWFRLFTFALIIVDVAVVIVEVSRGDAEQATEFLILDLVITIYFVFEIGVRIWVLGKEAFFSEWFNVVDFAVVLITLITAVAVVAATTGADWARKLSIVVVIRLVRLVRVCRVVSERKQVEISVRQLVSQNKRRYQQDGYDLDLTYVTGRVIATSFPSTGVWALYRNPIGRVAAFLNDKHEAKYRMYNLCSERTYDVALFGGDDVVHRFVIDDHNVPSLAEMVSFSQDVKDWMAKDPQNVIVVHCKGGKGRTGTMICVWLVESGVFASASTSLDYFGSRRTDTNVGKKFQGVETPSQSRYVGYYELLKARNLELPGPAPVVLKEIQIVGMMYVGGGSGDDFWMNVDVGRQNQVYSAHFGFQRNCLVNYNANRDLLTVSLFNCPTLDGDVRVLFQTSSKAVPKGYEKCPFYFWFNTALERETEVVLNREDLDNPHKSKTWHVFRKNFQVRVKFERV